MNTKKNQKMTGNESTPSSRKVCLYIAGIVGFQLLLQGVIAQMPI